MALNSHTPASLSLNTGARITGELSLLEMEKLAQHTNQVTSPDQKLTCCLIFTAYFE